PKELPLHPRRREYRRAKASSRELVTRQDLRDKVLYPDQSRSPVLRGHHRWFRTCDLPRVCAIRSQKLTPDLRKTNGKISNRAEPKLIVQHETFYLNIDPLEASFNLGSVRSR